MKINFFAPINDLGYGVHAYNTIKAFEARGHKITLVPPFGQVRKNDEHIDRWLANRETFDANAPGIMIFHEEYLTQFTGRPRIGFPVFECEQFSPLQLAAMKTCHYFFTPSKWGKEVLKSAGCPANKIYVVNEGFDPEVFPFREKSISEEIGQAFTFLHVGKYEERKGTLQVIRCFFNALERERARLVMHIDNPFVRDFSAIDNLLQKLGFITTNAGKTWRRMDLSIHMSLPVETPQDMAKIYAMADAGIYPSRSEGWGLPIIETIATGAPTIVGRWTGQSEFLTPQSMGEILHAPYSNYLRLAKAIREPAFGIAEKGDWYVPQDEELEERILWAFQNAREYRAGSAWKMNVESVRRFTWARAAEQLENALKEILL